MGTKASKPAKMMAIIFLLLWATLSFAQHMQTVTYQPTDEDIFNPERGFSTYLSSPVTLSLCNSLKAQKLSVIQRIYTIPQYHDKPLPQSFLDLMQKDLDIKSVRAD